jgi:hypothetical protein
MCTFRHQHPASVPTASHEPMCTRNVIFTPPSTESQEDESAKEAEFKTVDIHSASSVIAIYTQEKQKPLSQAIERPPRKVFGTTSLRNPAQTVQINCLEVC